MMPRSFVPRQVGGCSTGDLVGGITDMEKVDKTCESPYTRTALEVINCRALGCWVGLSSDSAAFPRNHRMLACAFALREASFGIEGYWS